LLAKGVPENLCFSVYRNGEMDHAARRKIFLRIKKYFCAEFFIERRIVKLSTRRSEKTFFSHIHAILKEKTHLRVSSAQVRVDLSTQNFQNYHGNEKEEEGDKEEGPPLRRLTTSFGIS
jgi:hypothetical protein